VRSGLRSCALITVSEREDLRAFAEPFVLPYIVLATVPAPQGYTSASSLTSPRDPHRLAQRIVLGAEHVNAFATAYRHGDNATQAHLLGYPPCCAQFFERVWVQERWMDTTWPMMQQLPGWEDHVLRDPIVNMFWRYLGIRPVFHLPCSPRCSASWDLAPELWNLLPLDVQEWMYAILRWPVEWSALHGIGELRTPISRTCFATDATAEKLTIEYHGTEYPVEGATGIKFPHMQPPLHPASPLALTHATTLKPADLAMPLPILPFKGKPFVFDEKRLGCVTTPDVFPYRRAGTTPLHGDAGTIAPSFDAYGYYLGDPARNGFTTREQMHAAHCILIHFIRDAVNPGPGLIVDLGAGDGTLLARLARPLVLGIESERQPQRVMPLTFLSIRDFLTGRTERAWPALLLCALERFEEDPNLLALLRGAPVVVYSYAPGAFELRSYRALGRMTSAAALVQLHDTCSALFFPEL